jgi:hypothetical protein
MRMAGHFASPATPGEPRRRDTTIFWAADPTGAARDWSDAQLATIANVGRWKVELFLAGNTGGTPDAVQFATTLARASTVAELQQKAFPQLTPAMRERLVAGASANGRIALKAGDRIQVGGGGVDGWTVPPGALAPLQVQAQGRTSATNTARWNDFTNIPASARSADVVCSAQGSQDTHCAPTGGYAEGALWDQLQLSVSDARQETRFKTVNLFRI